MSSIELQDIDTYVNSQKSFIQIDSNTQTMDFGGFHLRNPNSNPVSDDEITTMGFADLRYPRLANENTFDENQTFKKDVIIEGSLTLLSSNITDIQTEIIMSDQLVIDNSGTSPSFVVNQKNTSNLPIVQIKDDDVVVLQIGADGAITQNPTITSINTRLGNLESSDMTQTTRLDGIDSSITSINSLNTVQNSRLDSIESLNTTQTTRLDGIDSSITSINSLNTVQNSRLDSIELLNTTQTTRLDGIDSSITSINSLNTVQNSRLDSIESLDTTQTSRLDGIDSSITSINSLNTVQNSRLDSIESLDITQTSRLDGIDSSITSINSLNTVQNSRLDSIESLNSTQTSRLDGIDSSILSINSVNTVQNSRLDSIESLNNTQTSNISSLQTKTAYTNTMGGVLFNENNVMKTNAFFLYDTLDNRLAVGNFYSENALVENLSVYTDLIKTDTTNNRIGIKKSNPSYTLDVTGDINCSGNFRVNGTILSSGGSGTVDQSIIQGSTNAVSGGSVYSELQGKADTFTIDTTVISGSSNPVSSGAVFNELSGKQTTLIYDNSPTSSSTNNLTSGTIYTALQNKKSWVGSTILNKLGLSSYTASISDLESYKWIYFGINTNGATVNITLPTQTELIGYNGLEIRFLNGTSGFANVMNIIPGSNTLINKLTTTYNLTSRQGTNFGGVYDESNSNWMLFSRGHA